MMHQNRLSRSRPIVKVHVNDGDLIDYVFGDADSELTARVESLIGQDPEFRAEVEVLRDAFGISATEESTFVSTVHRMLIQPNTTTGNHNGDRAHSARCQPTSRPSIPSRAPLHQPVVIPCVDYDERLVYSEDKGLCDKLPYKAPPVETNPGGPLVINYDDRSHEAEEAFGRDVELDAGGADRLREEVLEAPAGGHFVAR